MVVTYCTAQELADYLGLGIVVNTSSDPTQVFVETFINYAEDELDRRLKHTFKSSVVVTDEVHDIPNVYTFGWGAPIYLRHRNIKDIDQGQGDKIEVWDGRQYKDILPQATSGVDFNLNNQLGKISFRGFIYTILREDRLKITYRYGESSVPFDVKESCLKLAGIKLIQRSFTMDNIKFGANINPKEVVATWKTELDEFIQDRQEWSVVQD